MKKRQIFFLVLMLTAGFAAIASVLVINGNFNISFDDIDFTSNVVFTKASTKNLDVYNENSYEKSYNYRILRDATGEIGPFYSEKIYYRNNWYNDYSFFVDSSYPWFRRGGYCFNVSNSGQYHFDRDSGKQSSTYSFRITLAPQI